jgi:molecular chaperone IbpA
MAVAGFAKSNIDIEVANNTLVVKGSLEPNPLEGAETNPISEYLYKGIADRAFTRRFTLADTVEVKNAELINGMLKLWLENIIPDEKKPKKVDIVDTAETGKK